MKVEILAACRKKGALGWGSWHRITVELPVVNEETVWQAVYDAGYDHICRRVRWKVLSEDADVSNIENARNQ